MLAGVPAWPTAQARELAVSVAREIVEFHESQELVAVSLMDQGLRDADRVRVNAKADADRLLTAATAYGDRLETQTTKAADRLIDTAEQFGDGLVAFAEANRALLLKNVNHGLNAIGDRADTLAGAIRNAGEVEARRIERVRDDNISAINRVYAEERAAAIAARDAALQGAKDRYEFAVLGWTPADLASRAAIEAAFDDAVRAADQRRVDAVNEQYRLADAGVVSTREIAEANASGLLGYAASGSSDVLVQATKAADALVRLAGTQSHELRESAQAAADVLESRAETERERVMWHTFAQMNAVTANAEVVAVGLERDAAVRANEVRNATAAATLSVADNVNGVVKEMVGDAWMVPGSTAASVGERPPEIVTAAQVVTVHAATVEYLSGVAEASAGAAAGVVDRSDRAVRDADRAVDTAVLAFLTLSATEQQAFLSDERALAAWFLGVLGGQASSDADRLETAAAGMHADLAKAIRSLLAEVEKRGRDGVDAVRDHAAGVVVDLSTAMTQAISDIRNMLRTAAARYSTDIDNLYRKVDTQGRENLAEYVAALDRAKPDTKPAPAPDTRWPDDDGPYRDSGGVPMSVAEAVLFIESVDPADDVGFVAAELAYREAMAWEAKRFRGFAAELMTGGKTDQIEAERDRLAAATEPLHRAMLNARQERIEVLRNEAAELRRERDLLQDECFEFWRVATGWYAEHDMDSGDPWAGSTPEQRQTIIDLVLADPELQLYDSVLTGVDAQITGLEASVLETRTMLDDLGWWERNAGTVHAALDAAGMVPVIGAPADAVNTAIYLLEHDPANAALSAVGFVPVFGDAGTMAAKWGPEIGAAMAAAGKGAKRADNLTTKATGRVFDAGANRLVGASRAQIDPGKFTEYVLNPAHPVGGNKARVFESAFGFNQSNAEDLIAQLRRGVMENTPVPGVADKFGTRFTVDIAVTGPTGSGVVRTGWIYDPGSFTPRLITAYPR